MRGRNVILYFYPKDNTPGCNKEACSFRDRWDDFKEKGAVVLGVSTDTVKSHDKFAAKFKLPFTLLADENKGHRPLAYTASGEPKTFMGVKYTGTSRGHLPHRAGRQNQKSLAPGQTCNDLYAGRSPRRALRSSKPPLGFGVHLSSGALLRGADFRAARRIALSKAAQGLVHKVVTKSLEPHGTLSVVFYHDL